MLVINKDLSWFTMNGVKVEEWLACFNGEMPEIIAYAVDDDNPVYEKIMNTPAFNPVEDENKQLIDIVPVDLDSKDGE